MEIPPPSLVPTFNGPGISLSISAAATIPPRSCATNIKSPRNGVITFAKVNANEMAGLNNAPDTRKKTHTLIINEKPNEMEIRMRLGMSTHLASDGVATVAPGILAI